MAQEFDGIQKTAARELFIKQCKRWFGTANPERMSVKHWERMVRTRADPVHVRTNMDLELHYDHDPDWCFARYGMTQTAMPDGRIICIAGEHEDSYDPDFCIYNDVIVLRPASGQTTVTADSGAVEIYGYPEEVFPPTDFHTATLSGDKVLLIGSLGYAKKREIGSTPVYMLDTQSYRMEKRETKGTPPGWVDRHEAVYDKTRHAVTVRGGYVHTGEKDRVPYRGVHRLYLSDWRWEVLEEREARRGFFLEMKIDARMISGPEAILEQFTKTIDFGEFEYPRAKVDDFEDSKPNFRVEDAVVTVEPLYIRVKVLFDRELAAESVDRFIEALLAYLLKKTGFAWESREVAMNEWEEKGE